MSEARKASSIYRVAPKPDQVAHARACYEGRTTGEIFGHGRQFTHGEDVKNMFGTVAETIIADIFGKERPIMNGPDGGWDLVIEGTRCDVKTSIRSVRFKRGFVHNVYARQVRNNPCHAYIMVSYNRTDGEYEICGWITKDDFLKHAIHTPAGGERQRADGCKLVVQGTDGMFEIAQKHLRDMGELPGWRYPQT